ATELSHSAEEFGIRLDSLRERYEAAGQGNDFQYCLLHWLRTAKVPSLEYREEIARRLVSPGEERSAAR
ncbi:MAG: hypothetical protein AB1405_14800, partial [Bdellovibrionota bacterium]